MTQQGTTLTVKKGATTTYTVNVPTILTDVYGDIVQTAKDGGRDPASVKFGATPAPDTSWLGLLLTAVLPLLIIGGFIFFMMRQAQGTNNQALSFGKSRARMFLGNKTVVTFADVAGVDEAKTELQEVVEFLKFPEKFNSLGARIPRGVLLVGPPGTGKTLMARAVAGEAGVPFFSISGSEFVEMFVGVGASRVRDLFDQAKRNSPCIVFVDEIDAVGRQRGAGLGGSPRRARADPQPDPRRDGRLRHEHQRDRRRGHQPTRRPRPGAAAPGPLRPPGHPRPPRHARPRPRSCSVHTKGKPLDKGVDVEGVARQSPGFSGADLANLVNEAAILSARRNKKVIGMSEFQEALERIIAGPERKSRVISDAEKAIIAYHEGGHAVVQRILPKCDPVSKVTIISRGMALGYTMALPQEDRYLQSKTEFEDKIAGLLGGNVAERMIFGDTTTGASNDIEKATDLARRMVTEFGMSDKLGPLSFGKRDELVFLGREIGEQRNYSDDVARQIDEEVRAIIDKAYERAIGGPHDPPRPPRRPRREARRRGDRRRRGSSRRSSPTCRPRTMAGASPRSSAQASPSPSRTRSRPEPAAGLIRRCRQPPDRDRAGRHRPARRFRAWPSRARATPTCPRATSPGATLRCRPTGPGDRVGRLAASACRHSALAAHPCRAATIRDMPPLVQGTRCRPAVTTAPRPRPRCRVQLGG